ncbi:SusD family protein [Pedobacter steynii]|uniref:SusD family protein n=1 Tax=Pedobacter steynii TaxID=430522 RepID=A0A1H0LVS1_9SPHI|nr:RagB/SusD family nutrient uptake outer membrane protein [Pedobacter steynii]NQX43568.1 RagB/SusD family nutrient uptake outer membrane protein [Pedobacter steynii]SDO72302.1 SusD family protein [Pedobacter steynii]
MKNYIEKFYSLKTALVLMLFMTATSCKQDFKDPNGALAADVLKSAKGLTGVAVGLQRVYSVGRPGVFFSSITANGFVTNELFLSNAGNIPELQLFTGGAKVDGTNSILTNLWANSSKIIFDADNVINNAANLADKSYASGLIAYSSIFKALAIGNLSQYWQQVPNGIGQQVPFVSRKDGFIKAISVIDNALSVITANPVSSAFLANIPKGIDIKNTLYALKARYALFSENYPLALTSAGSVDLNVKSYFGFDGNAPNPIYDIATSTNNVFQPLNATLGLKGTDVPDVNDKRVPFHILFASKAPLISLNGFGNATAAVIPVYLPGEMILIKAEALARQPDPGNALIELNKVVTKTAALDVFGLGAALPELTGTYSQDDLLALIYKHRCIELYLSGLKIEDMRRFAKPLTDRKRNFFPYPFVERDGGNLNVPADPAF